MMVCVVVFLQHDNGQPIATGAMADEPYGKFQTEAQTKWKIEFTEAKRIN